MFTYFKEVLNWHINTKDGRYTHAMWIWKAAENKRSISSANEHQRVGHNVIYQLATLLGSTSAQGFRTWKRSKHYSFILLFSFFYFFSFLWPLRKIYKFSHSSIPWNYVRWVGWCWGNKLHGLWGKKRKNSWRGARTLHATFQFGPGDRRDDACVREAL